MKIYQAMMLAADQIEQHPDSFRFSANQIPEDCGTQGCVLGWAAFFAQYQHKAEPDDKMSPVGHFAHDVFHFPSRYPREGQEMGFYHRMSLLQNSILEDNGDDWRDWIYTPRLAAKLLRLYAEKYHGHEKPRPTQELVNELMAKIEKIPEVA